MNKTIKQDAVVRSLYISVLKKKLRVRDLNYYYLLWWFKKAGGKIL